MYNLSVESRRRPQPYELLSCSTKNDQKKTSHHFPNPADTVVEVLKAHVGGAAKPWVIFMNRLAERKHR
jgi:hypothetical protein